MPHPHLMVETSPDGYRWLRPDRPAWDLAVGAWLLPDMVGRATAMDLVLTGRRAEAAEALTAGLLDRLRAERAANRSARARAIPIPPGP